MMPIGQVHLVAALTAIASGAAVLVVRPKGARWHRRLGWLYVASMLTVNGTALVIYRLFGGFGPFHAMALLSLVTIAFGTVAALRARHGRRRGQPAARQQSVTHHFLWMTWSYVGLLAAFASETITRYPAFRPMLGGGRHFGLAVAVATSVIVSLGAWRIQASQRSVLAPFMPDPDRVAR